METTKRYSVMIRALWLLLALLLSPLAATLHAETAVGGAIATDTTWQAADGPFLVTADLVVDSGATLTIGPGVTVRFQAGKRLVVKNGSLRVNGTATSMVLFTSWRDVTAGTPAAGDWGGLEFQDGTADATTLLEHAVINFGSTTIIRSASPTFNSCRFMNNSGFALDVDLFSFPHGAGNIASGNSRDAIRVPAGEMTASGAWDLTGIPYYLDGEISVGAAPTISGITPQDLEQGSSVSATITGTRLSGAKNVTFSDAGVSATIQPGGSSTSLPLQVTVTAAAQLGPRTFTATVAAGEVSSQLSINVIPPVPVITSITPDRVFVSRPTITVEIGGSNFIAETVAELAGTPLVTRYVSPVLLQADIPAQSLARVSQMKVKNPDPRSAGAFIFSNGMAFTVELPQFVFSPDTLSLRQGEANSALNLTIPFAAPAGGLTVNIASADTVAATVPATVTIPAGSSSTSVTVTAPDTSNTHEVTLDISAYQNNWLGNKATVTVRPEPTVNLAPVTLLSGQGFTFFLTVNLTDPAPAGGLVVDLATTPANILTLPASVTVAAGATQAQVTVTNTNTGSAVITATPAAGKGFTAGDNCSVTVKPIQLTNVNPLVSRPVGVMLATTAPTTERTVTYTPQLSKPVGVAFGPVITGMVPDRAPLGTQNLLVRVNGSGLAAATAVSVTNALTLSGVTVQSNSLSVAPDGSYVEFRMDIAADAEVADRIVTITANGTAVPPVSVNANRFKVTWPQPELWSLVINDGVVGSTMNLQLSGRFLQGASEISFVPPQGILVTTPPSVSADGANATAQIFIAADAAVGVRTVRITTPGGITPATAQLGNQFTIRAVPGTTYTPVVSKIVGVTLQSAPLPTTTDKTYTPLVSRPTGVSFGPVITSTSPSSGAIGATDLRIRVNGFGLGAVDSFTIEPNTGLTVNLQPAAADGTWVEALISIAADAALTERTIVLKAGTTAIPPATAGASRFRVTLPQPVLTSIAPNRREAGSNFTLTVNGRLLSGATAVSFEPPTGITVVNPPSVSADGTLATVNVIIAADAPTGQRVVTITTPGGTTSSAPTINTFLITAVAGTTYTPVTSQPVGVKLATAAPPTSRDVNYGPVLSSGVGVFLPPPAPPTSRDVSYGAIVTRPVGVAFGSVLTAMSPTMMAPGTTATLNLSGFGLDKVTGVTVSPSDGMTLGTVTQPADGQSLAVQITSDAAAPRMPRTVVLNTAAGPVAAPGRINILYVGKRPALTSLSPATQTVGTTFTLTIYGTDLDAATAVRFEPSAGIKVINPPTVNAGGTQATVSVVIDGTIASSQRVVIVEGPYGASDNISGWGNTFSVNNPTFAAAPAPARKLAGHRTGSSKESMQTCPAGSPQLLTLCFVAGEAIPVVRRSLPGRSIPLPVTDHADELPALETPGGDTVTRRALMLLPVIGWGYRAPPYAGYFEIHGSISPLTKSAEV